MSLRSRSTRAVVGLAVAAATTLSPTAAASAVGAAALLCDSDGDPAPAAARGAISRDPSGWKQAPIEEAPAGPTTARVTIPVHFHVLTDGAEGHLELSDLRAQVAVLNNSFGGPNGTGFSFVLASADYTDNGAWFRMGLGTTAERQAKAATHVGDADDLNVWTTSNPSYLGFATFPSWYKRSPQLDGIVLDHESFPGGAYGSNYSLGETGTHEVGHWLGLLHTFQGGCNAKGDYVADTPAQQTPTGGCPEGKDTCPAPGTDPIHNFMDYSYDSCYTEFTAGQTQRMRDQWFAFRADGGHPVGQT